MKGYQTRIRILTIPFVLIACIVAAKLYFLQVVDGSTYARKASSQAVSPQAGIFDRGNIYFTDKKGETIAAATLGRGYTLAIKPKDIENREALYASLANILPIDTDMFFARAGKKGDPYEEIATHLTEEQAKAIRALKSPAVVLEDEQWRYYPAGSLAAQTVGFVAYDNDANLKGRYGLERYYDDVLSRDGESVYVNFFAEIFSAAREVFGAQEETRGDVITTIDPTVALALERELKNVSETWHTKKTGGIIMDPQTGEIYAMAVYPSFDLNSFASVSPDSFANPLVERVYEMGSIVKPLTVAAGLDSGAVTASTLYTDTGFLKVDGATIRNFDGVARGRVPVQEVLNQSLNVGSAFIADTMGNEAFTRYMKAYGLGEETGIDLPGEVSGLISNLDSPRKVEHFTAAFGQGIALTPIETVRALASLGNGGFLVTPHVVKSIRHETGVVRVLSQPEKVRILKEETSREISRMLTEVVDTALVEGAISLPHTSVAAKTGTAQIANPAGGGYYDDRYLHSFFGYFPSYNPRFIIFLFALEPQGVKYASQTLTDPFHRLTKFLITYYEVPPDR